MKGKGLCPVSKNYARIRQEGSRKTTKDEFFLVSRGGLRLSPLGTSATIWPIVPSPDDR
jgi:hypothetical protein